MATVIQLHWREATPELYEQIRHAANWEADRPPGAILHLVGFAEDGMHITDVWDSPEDFQAFFETRVLPTLQAEAITTQPDMKVFELHGIYAPAYGQTTQTASV
ncbi:MAG: hypothetical protein ACRDQZ_00455 [Mycobacteriales bacterium]